MTILRLLIFILFSASVSAQPIPSNRVLSNEELSDFLKPEIKNKLSQQGEITEHSLAFYFRQVFAQRFFYDYHTVNERLDHYHQLYNNRDGHRLRAEDHMNKYPGEAQWKLPYMYKDGTPVNAYAMRHLARQHKMVDIAFFYFEQDQDPQYIRYFEAQMQSLNDALESGAYEKIEDGNGVYEAFRSGYRVLNWLWIHNLFLNEQEYQDADQLTTIATLLQHGQHLYERNEQFHSGNHQTRGVSALAMLAILLNDFEGSDKWLERAMTRLTEHLDREINPDGFQFERSVHYHMSDINNYYYVYQLAKINQFDVGEEWEKKLRSLFTTLVKIAYPNRAAPVLQDDTEIPWAETNDISGAMTLGYLLFEDPEFGYFASDKVDDRVYWFLNQAQIDVLSNIHKKRPTYGSLTFEDTGYYIMREGWNHDDMMMIISAGLDDEKPDHQHGDMLGIQAMAHGHAILPNYQVRYSLEDFDFFKNSMVKNVALVDDELLGKQWTSNQGGSGFGKFLKLPQPEVIAWDTNENIDLFIGQHNGFQDVGVEYTRQVIFVKDEFWIVKDDFESDGQHSYKQVWQGHYTSENGPHLLRAVAPDASGHDILQLSEVDSIHTSGTRGKQWSIVSKSSESDYSFITVVYPYKGYNNRLDETAQDLTINDWKVNSPEWQIIGDDITSLIADHGLFVFHTRQLIGKGLTIESTKPTDLYILFEGNETRIQSLDKEAQTISVHLNHQTKTKTIHPGEVWVLEN